MKLSARQKYDSRDIDPWELKLVRVGHALWAMMKRDRARNGGYLSQGDPIYEALETVWRLKREYRAELKIRRAEESAKLKERFQVGTLVEMGKPLFLLEGFR